MEKRLNKRIETYVTDFKDNIRNKINSIGFNEQSKINELLEYVYDYDRLQIKKEDLAKNVRVKNVVHESKRCTAKRCNGEQCTRTKKSESMFCGTHIKGTPHGLIKTSENSLTNTIHKVNIYVKEIYGIHYYIDDYGNVYKTEDILAEKQNPSIVAKYILENEIYSITEFSI
jgi:hypothetical protein